VNFCVIIVLYLIVVPFPPGKNTFAVQLNNNNNNSRATLGCHQSELMGCDLISIIRSHFKLQILHNIEWANFKFQASLSILHSG
jgi:hypothetical protein